MAFFINKERGKLTLYKTFGSSVAWTVEWPIMPGARADWKYEIRKLALRAGATVTFSIALATVRACNGDVYNVDGAHRPNDWKLIFLRFIDALHAGKIPLPDGVHVCDLFPPVDVVPTPAGMEDGFTPMAILKKRDAGQDASMLRELRSVSYSEALRLGVDSVCDKPYGITYGQKTSLKLIECACGRLFVAHPKIIDGHKAQRWGSCGCADGYNGGYKYIMRAAWREYCTMLCLDREPMAALHKIFVDKNICMDCDLPSFEDFWAWYLVNSRLEKQQYVQRIDDTKPFSLDNLYIPKERKLIVDDDNKDCFKISI